VSTITAKQLPQATQTVLNKLEEGESLFITRNGRPIGRIEPMTAGAPSDCNDVMAEVWNAQVVVKASERVPNPVLQSRNRRRR
jgi:antitoxin (DNA-binding transcriptional repressor) of toxin-antitoxin stability system